MHRSYVAAASSASSSITLSFSPCLPSIVHPTCTLQENLEGIDGIVLPGGESTTMGLIAEWSGTLIPALKALVAKKMPIFATCAGLIMLAEKAIGEKEGGQPLLGGLKVTVDRNHFGSQLKVCLPRLHLPCAECRTPL